jgi:phospholipid/cholesterol/gamma-HCH transport system substrate-binding protein
MSREVKTGIVAVVIIGLFVWGYNFLKGQNLFEANSRTFYVEYDNIRGLNKASAVSINGLQVGKVSDITFNKNPEKRGNLVVEITVDDDFEFTKKSVVKIYSTGIIGGEAIAIIPSYEGEIAKDGDYLKGEVERDIFTSVGASLNPLKAKVENLIIEADSLLISLNDILDAKTRRSFKNTISGFENTVTLMNNTMGSLNELIDDSKTSINVSLRNTETITDNFAKVSDTLVSANLGETVKTLQATLDNMNGLMANIQKNDGTLGKLMNDDALYENLANASKEMEELLREMKLNPKRFVHFSLFGKRPKPYNPENNKNNVSNQKK